MEFTVTYLLIGVTCLVSYLSFNNRELFDSLKHYPYTEQRNGEWYRMLSSGFVHGSTIHLIINMYVLYIFGEVIEWRFTEQFGLLQGRMYYLVLYLVTIIAADLPAYFKHKDNPYYAAIGASGATSGIVFIYCLFYPWNWLGLMFIIPIPAIIFGVLYLFYSSWADKNAKDNIGHDAHFYGAIFGLLMALAFNYSWFFEFLNVLMEGPKWPPPGF